MKVSRAQAEENRRIVITEAARLFREKGFNGVGLNDLMGAAGLTQGGFYNQFKSKDELIKHACQRALADGVDEWNRSIETAGANAYTEVVTRYLSCGHRDAIGQGCAFASLGPDAARHSPELHPSFEVGLKDHLETLEKAMRASAEPVNGDPVVVFSTMIGALLLSRIVEDEAFSRQILDKAVNSLLHRDEVPGAEALN